MHAGPSVLSGLPDGEGGDEVDGDVLVREEDPGRTLDRLGGGRAG